MGVLLSPNNSPLLGEAYEAVNLHSARRIIRRTAQHPEQEITWQQNYLRTGFNNWERMCAQSILWSHKSNKLKTIADLCEVDRDTESRWRPSQGLLIGR